MEFVTIWLAGMILVGWMANKRGRSAVLWAVIALLISPLLGFVILLVMPGPKKAGDDEIENLVAARRLREHPDQDALRKAKAQQEASIDAMRGDR